MPKKKQAPLHSNIPGKFIPRDESPSAPGFRPGASTNRFNSKMAELLASSESSSRASSLTRVNNENEQMSNMRMSPQNEAPLSNASEMTTGDSSRIHARLFHRRIVTMLETLKGRNANDETKTCQVMGPKPLPSYMESKSQPITFGQLRRATMVSASQQTQPTTTMEEMPPSRMLSARSCADFSSVNMNSDKQSYYTNARSGNADTRSDLKSAASSVSLNKSSSKHQANKEHLYYSPSLEQLLEQYNVVPRMKHQDDSKQEQKVEEPQQQSKSPLTVDEILATYYSKVKVSTTMETQMLSSQPSSNQLNNNMGFYMNPTAGMWNTPQTNQWHVSPPPHPAPLLLNEQNRNRPPPPSYSASIASGHRPPLPTNDLGQRLIRPTTPASIPKQIYTEPQISPHLLPGNSPITLPSSPTSVFTSSAIRPPPPRYEQSSSSIERSHSALSSMNRPNYSQTNPPQAGFDREFSRLLYGKVGRKSRSQQQKRKAFSDPVKKSVEEAGRSVDKTHRRLTNQLNKNDTVNEEEENSNDSNEPKKSEKNLRQQRRLQRQSEFPVNNRESAKKAIVPPNPLLKRPIPSFLHVYSEASPSTDIRLQWHLFSLSELESFGAMLTKLYRDENFARVQCYENYRALLMSVLESKKPVNRVRYGEDDSFAITTTAL